MDIFFCDICNESVPQSDLDKGMACSVGRLRPRAWSNGLSTPGSRSGSPTG